MTISAPGSELTEMYRMLADAVRPDQTVVDAMDRLAEACTSYTEAVAANILFSDHAGKLSVVASSGYGATDVEEAQLSTGTGPSIWAVHSGKPLEVAEIALTRGVWPSFAHRAETRGFHASQTFPMRLRNHSLGGISLYFDHRGAVTNRDLAMGHAVAQTAIVTLVHHDTIDRKGIMSEHLTRARETRALVRMAQHTLAEQQHISADKALATLRARAKRAQIGISEQARQITNFALDSDSV
jgi:hypothetical protein